MPMHPFFFAAMLPVALFTQPYWIMVAACAQACGLTKAARGR